MRSRRRWPGVSFAATLLVVALALATAWAQKVEMGYDKAADFSQFKTYSLVPRATPATNPLVATIVDNDVAYELDRKGLRKVDSDPDLLVKVYGGASGVEGGFAAEDPSHAATGGEPLPGGTMWSGSLAPTPVPQVMHGSITVDLVDARQKHLVWRARAKGKMDYDKRSKLMEQASKAVTEMFKKYPPSSK